MSPKRLLTHWGRVTHICASKLTSLVKIIASRWQVNQFPLKKTHFNMSSGKWRPFCLGRNVLDARWEQNSYDSFWCHKEFIIQELVHAMYRVLSFKKQNIYKALHNLMHIIVRTEKKTRMSNHTWHVGKYRVVWLANLSLLSQWCSSSFNFWEFKPVCKKGDIMDVYSDKSINFRHAPCNNRRKEHRLKWILSVSKKCN